MTVIAPKTTTPATEPVKEGLVVVYDDSGNVTLRANYVAGALDGEVTGYDGPTGRKLQVAHYRAGLLDGEMVKFDEEGRAAARSAYKAGKAHGDTRVYHEGRLQIRIAFIAGREDGPQVSFDDEGNETIRGQNRNGKREGEWIVFMGKGAILRKERYRAGRLHGEVVDFWPNGKVREKTMYVDGKKDGESLIYHPNAQIRIKQLYKGGEAKGEPYEYDDRGNLKSAPKSGKADTSIVGVISGLLSGKG